jgi:mono/diheme cytochrome c family protein
VSWRPNSIHPILHVIDAHIPRLDRTGGGMTMWKRTLPAVFLVLAVQTPAVAEEADIGARLYQESCSGCHGATGKGGGELSQLLKIDTPALTGLAAANDGVYPMLDVIHIIDGRSGVRGHGGPMPIFGSLYSASSVTAGTDYGSVVEVRGRILSLAMYLESIQE